MPRSTKPAGRKDLLIHADILFEQWQRVRDGTLTRRGFQTRYLHWLRPEVRKHRERGSAYGCAKTSGVCREVLALEESLWTFASVMGVEPTNNATERAVRHAVCWRKTRYGMDSVRGSRFVERILTGLASCRQQGRGILQFLTEAIQAQSNGGERSSLVPQSLGTVSLFVTIPRKKRTQSISSSGVALEVLIREYPRTVTCGNGSVSR